MAEHKGTDDQAVEDTVVESDGAPREKAYRVERRQSRAAMGLNSLAGKLVFGSVGGCLLVVLACLFARSLAMCIHRHATEGRGHT